MEDRLEELGERIDRLGRRAQAAFFCACGHGLLPLYRRFAERARWGDPGALERALDAAAGHATGGPEIDPDRLLAELEGNTPHSDDFPPPESTFAQDAVICVDAAVRCAGGRETDGRWVEYALEPMTMALAERDLEVLSPGDGAEGDAWRARLPDDPAMTAALRFCREAVEELSAVDGAVPPQLLERLADRAHVLRPPER